VTNYHSWKMFDYLTELGNFKTKIIPRHNEIILFDNKRYIVQNIVYNLKPTSDISGISEVDIVVYVYRCD